MIEKFKFWLKKLIANKILVIIKKWIDKRPLNPSIKFDPFIINKKHNNIKQVWKNLFSNHKFKKSKPDLFISIEKSSMLNNRIINIITNLIFEFILNLKSSTKPKKNSREYTKLIMKKKLLTLQILELVLDEKPEVLKNLYR